MGFTDLVIQKANALTDKTVIIAGWWYNEIMVTTIDQITNNQVVFEGYIDNTVLDNYHKNGYAIFYLPEQNKYNDLKFRMQVTDQFARAFIE